MTAGQVRILQSLETYGATKALFFDEAELDTLFKMRPRLIALKPGHNDAVIDITSEGRKVLHQWLKSDRS